jgi:cGMP-dependent protein kinase
MGSSCNTCKKRSVVEGASVKVNYSGRGSAKRTDLEIMKSHSTEKSIHPIEPPSARKKTKTDKKETRPNAEAAARRISMQSDLVAKTVQVTELSHSKNIKAALSRSEVLRHLTKAQASQLAEVCKVQVLSRHQAVVPDGTHRGSGVWIVLKGAVFSSNQNVEALGILGDSELLSGEGELPGYKAQETGTTVGFISRRMIEDTIHCRLGELQAVNEAKTALRNVELYRALSTEKFEALTSHLTLLVYAAGEVIFAEGTPADAFYIIKSGSVHISVKGSIVRTMGPLSFFGERAMLLEGELRSATVTANEPTECWALTKSNFFSVIDDHITQVLLKRINLQDERVVLDDLQMIKALGGGMFGKVFMTLHRTKRVLYALKVVEKARVVRLDTWKALLHERDILLQMNHILVMKLVKTMKDTKYVYFLMECVLGRDLFDVIRDMGLFSYKEAVFYGACILLILEYFQQKKVVYRDLKPENIMVDEDGYPKLIDFGTAKILEGRTFTVVGTPHYMAPEMITGNGYNNSVDLWSLGVIMFEMLTGALPYGEEENDPYVVYEQILTQPIVYPPGLHPKSKAIIELLMCRDPAKRSGGSIKRLKSHSWFSTIVWVSST